MSEGKQRRRIIDLSFEVYQGMMVYPSVTKPAIVEMENHRQMARSMGTDVPEIGITHLPNHCMIVTGDHVGTHLDSWGHVNPAAPRAEGIPLDYCYGDGVVLDLSAKGPGEEIWPDDLAAALERIEYELKPLDIVLLRTDAANFRDEKRYLTDHPGMTKEATSWLLDRGVMTMGIDAPGFDLPVPFMFEKKKYWESHMVMLEREYYHLENMCNLDQIPPPYHSFIVSVLPVKWRGASAAHVRAVAIIEP